MIKRFADENKIDIFETSAKDGIRVADAFIHITKKLIDKR